MVSVLERSHETVRSTDAQQHKPRTRRRFPIAALAVTLILIHATDAWIFQVEGSTSVGRRVLLGAVVMVAFAIALIAATRFSPRWLANVQIFVGLPMRRTQGQAHLDAIQREAV